LGNEEGHTNIRMDGDANLGSSEYKSRTLSIVPSSPMTFGKQLCQGITFLTQLYCRIYISISITCFDSYGHCKVGYSIRGKTILYNMVQCRH